MIADNKSEKPKSKSAVNLHSPNLKSFVWIYDRINTVVDFINKNSCDGIAEFSRADSELIINSLCECRGYLRFCERFELLNPRELASLRVMLSALCDSCGINCV